MPFADTTSTDPGSPPPGPAHGDPNRSTNTEADAATGTEAGTDSGPSQPLSRERLRRRRDDTDVESAAHSEHGSAGAPAIAAGGPRSTSVVEILGADKSFHGVQALRNLSIAVAESRISVLLGPNGAGKTTAIRLITGALKPDRGQVLVFGLDPSGPDGEEIRRQCGVVSAKPSLYDRLSGRDNLRYAAELYGLGRGAKANRRIDDAADQFGILYALEQQVGGYSTGMKTRLALARAVLHEPTLMLLDEPTSGLDPESAMAVLGMVRDMTDAGRTVLMCTHLLLEAEGLADQVVVVDDGTDLVAGRPVDLADHYWPTPTVDFTAIVGSDLDQLSRAPGVVGFQRQGPTARLELDSPGRVPQLVRRLTADGVSIEAVVPYRPSLEDLYFAIRREKLSVDVNGGGAGAGPGALPGGER